MGQQCVVVVSPCFSGLPFRPLSWEHSTLPRLLLTNDSAGCCHMTCDGASGLEWRSGSGEPSLFCSMVRLFSLCFLVSLSCALTLNQLRELASCPITTAALYMLRMQDWICWVSYLCLWLHSCSKISNPKCLSDNLRRWDHKLVDTATCISNHCDINLNCHGCL